LDQDRNRKKSNSSGTSQERKGDRKKTNAANGMDKKTNIKIKLKTIPQQITKPHKNNS